MTANEIKLENEKITILNDSVLKAYNNSIKSYNKKAYMYLEQFDSKNGVLAGSSPLMIIQLINSGALQKKIRLASGSDLKYALSKNPAFLGLNYVDFALALRTEKDSYKPNDLLSKRLSKQLSQRGIKLGKGKLIPFDALSLIDEEDSEYGILIDLKKDAEKSIIELDSFEWEYPREDGLSRAGINRYGSWISYGAVLGYSNAGGRVVVVLS